MSDLNLLGWIFVLGLALTVIGFGGRWAHRSVHELRARLAPGEGESRHSKIAEAVLPVRRRGRRFANRRFHEAVDARAHATGASRTLFWTGIAGALILAVLFAYLAASGGEIAFTR